MDRIIKFRIWDVGRMFYKCSVGEHNPSVYDSEKGFVGWKECTEDAIFMQFTGLYDKNGKEIWEGDLVKVYANYEGDYWVEEFIGIIEYVDGGFSIRGGRFFYADINTSCEVIGNIYEDAKLLKKEQ